MTNGEKLKEVFPSIELYEKSHDGIQINFDSVWWNAEYKEPSSSEKPNKSEISTGSDDCISRQDVLSEIIRFSTEEGSSVECQQLYCDVNNMPSVTPQEPTRGHWKLVQRGKCIDVCCSNCKAVRIKEWAYNYTIDQLDKEDIKECLGSDDMRYCPYCGSDNREEEDV